MSTNSPKISHTTKSNIFHLNFFPRGIKKYDNKSAAGQFKAGLDLFSMFCLWKCVIKRVFLDIIYPRHFHSVTWEIYKLRGPSSLLKCSKINVDFRNGANNSKQVICFLDNCIWIGCGQISLLRRQYSSYSHITTQTFSKSISLRVMNNMIKVLSCRFRQCLGPFNMLTIKGCSETGLFRLFF